MTQFSWSGFDAMRKLSPNEAMEFAARVAELTKAGLPLGTGLRALADEMPGGRLPRVLHGMADRLDAGDDLLAVLDSQAATLPVHLRGLMLAGLRSGRLAEVLDEYVALEQTQCELRRHVAMTLAYPCFLLLVITGLTALAALLVVPQFSQIFKDFGTKLPDVTLLAIEGAQPVMWLLVGLTALVLTVMLALGLSPGTHWLWPLLYRVPMLGPLLRWSQLAQWARLMELLLEQEVALADAVRISAAGLRDASLARGCLSVAADLTQGRPLDESLAARRQFPASLIPMIQWGQQASALSDAFHGAAIMYEERVRAHGTLLEAMLLPLTFLVTLVSCGFFVIAMFMPLIALISNLSGGN